MLTGETAVGIDPTHRADARRGDPRRRVADAVARDRSRPRGHRRAAQPRALPVGGDAGGSGNADAIVAVTRGGKTAHMLSAFRPRSASSRSRRTRRSRGASRSMGRPAAGRRHRPDRPGDRAPAARAQPAARRQRGRVPLGERRPHPVGRQLPPHPSYLTRWWRPAANASVESDSSPGPPGGPPSHARRSISMDRDRASIHLSGESIPPDAIMAPIRPPSASSRDHNGPTRRCPSPRHPIGHIAHAAGRDHALFRQLGCSISRWSLASRL